MSLLVVVIMVDIPATLPGLLSKCLSWQYQVQEFLLTDPAAHPPQSMAPAGTVLPGSRREVPRTSTQNDPVINKIQ